MRILVSYLETVMSNTSTENEALIKDLMYKCDCLYRENSRLREKVSAQPLGVAEKEAYELQLSEKDTIIAKKEAKISKLEERVAYLERQLYGRKAEKFIKPDAQDRWLDFEGFDMLPEEAEAAAVSIFLITNTIVIGITVRKDEISIMKYIGATDAFVNAPFFVEGIVIGLIGAIIPVAILRYIYGGVVNFVLGKFSVLQNILAFMPASEVFEVLIPEIGRAHV